MYRYLLLTLSCYFLQCFLLPTPPYFLQLGTDLINGIFYQEFWKIDLIFGRIKAIVARLGIGNYLIYHDIIGSPLCCYSTTLLFVPIPLSYICISVTINSST